MIEINCTKEENLVFARCIIRDDTTLKTQIATLIVMAMMFFVAGICIKNLIALKRAKELKKVKGITILNITILVFTIGNR
jgi:hypothetical protein